MINFLLCMLGNVKVGLGYMLTIYVGMSISHSINVLFYVTIYCAKQNSIMYNDHQCTYQLLSFLPLMLQPGHED